MIGNANRKTSFLKEVSSNKELYILLIPIILFYAIFHYGPMYGVLIAFKDFSPRKGILGSDWAGLTHFIDFFKSPYAFRVIRNTFMISLKDILYGFPAPIILALLMNELRNDKFKKVVQTTTYLPHFISMVVICGMLKNFLSLDGAINKFLAVFGVEPKAYFQFAEYFQNIFVFSGIWQGVGYGSIIYLAAITSIDPQLYEAATIDGAGRFRQIWNITLPGISSTIIILLILRIGNIMSVGFEKIILLYNPVIYETSDVISSFVYRKGLLELEFSFAAAVGLFNSIVNFVLLISANMFSRKVSETSLW